MGEFKMLGTCKKIVKSCNITKLLKYEMQVKTPNGMTKESTHGNGVKEGCLLSPLPFVIYLYR